MRRQDKEMEQVTAEIAEIVNAELRNNVLNMSANDLGKEFEISENTAAKILRGLGLVYNGHFWYMPKGEKYE